MGYDQQDARQTLPVPAEHPTCNLLLDYPYMTSTASAIYTELILQIITLVVLCKVAIFAATRGYYVVGTEKYLSVPDVARFMYVGAL
jgi:hypothetical protein